MPVGQRTFWMLVSGLLFLGLLTNTGAAQTPADSATLADSARTLQEKGLRLSRGARPDQERAVTVLAQVVALFEQAGGRGPALGGGGNHGRFLP